MLNQLKQEEFEKLKNGRKWDQINAGDTVEVERLPFVSANKPEIIKGLVIARVNRASDSSITLINVRPCKK